MTRQKTPRVNRPPPQDHTDQTHSYLLDRKTATENRGMEGRSEAERERERERGREGERERERERESERKRERKREEERE